MNTRRLIAPSAACACALLILAAADPAAERLARHRNLGKAFYENPATQAQAVEEFRRALELAPNSARDRLNYGLALLRAGKTPEGVAELERVQKQEPSLPHTWFNLGIAYKRAGDYERAIAQFRRMVELVPAEAIAHYNLGVLHKALKQADIAVRYFQTASRLDPHLAAPHFQLYNSYRQAGRKEDAGRELATFQEIKKRQEGAAVPEDVEWCYYAEIYEPIVPKPAPGPQLALRLQSQRLAGRADPKTAGLAAIDAAGRGRPDLLVWSSEGLRLYRDGLTPVAASGLDGVAGVLAAVPGDFNNDGLMDLCILTVQGPRLYLNRKTAFARRDVPLPQARFETAVWLDYDHDYDVDLFLLGARPALLRNNGGGAFEDRTADFPFATPGRAIAAAAFRLVADSKGVDLAVAYADRAGILYRDKLAGKYEPLPLLELPAGATGLLPADLDADGEIDLVLRGALLMNRRGRFERKPAAPGPAVLADLANRGLAELTAEHPAFPKAVAFATADFNLDGRMDLAAVGADGSIVRLLNQTAPENNWLRIALAGIKNPKLAPAAEVEIKSGTLYQKRIYEGLPLLFGLGGEKVVDAVRITWPNGLIQNETQQPARRSLTYQEAQRLSGSCPMIFTWNGREFQFVTDVLGVAPLGASAGNGEYFPVDHDEYVEIPVGALVPRGGEYEVRITEELREVSYLDQVRLIALDHPAHIEIFTNDKFKSPPFPEFRLFGVTRRLYPRSAIDHRGRSVLRQLLNRDRSYAAGFERDYTGIAEMHSLTLDFGKTGTDTIRFGRLSVPVLPVTPPGNSVLILNGWVDWADGSSFLAASQRPGGGLVMPYLQVRDATGAWKTVIEDMGIPAGKPKTIVVDLSGKFLSASREVRIVTNLCVYWDEVFLSEQTAAPPARLTHLIPRTAALAFRGFSRAIVHPQRTQPEAFDYAHVSPISMWGRTPGHYTPYGEVKELLEVIDDRLAIMGSGDELRLKFDASALPPLAPGWRRDFLLFVDGWAKDGDLNTAYSQTVEPLPFHGMSRYPDTIHK